MGYGRAGGSIEASRGHRSLARTFASAIFQCVAIVAIAFAFLRLAPGSPVDALAAVSGAADPAARAHLERTHGLQLPLDRQFIAYTAGLLRGDLGTSIYFEQPVAHLLAQRLPVTAGLSIGAILLALVLGTAGGVLSAGRPHSPSSRLVVAMAIFLQAIPSFVLATLLMILVGMSGWLPVFGLQSFSGTRAAGADMLLHLITPATALTLTLIAPYILIARTAMSEVLPQDYIRLAHAKGLPEARVLLKHALPNAIIPILMIGGQQFATLIGGTIVIETVFGIPGVGRLAVEAALRRDYPLVSSVILLTGVAVVCVYKLCETLVAVIDPRIPSSRGRA